MTERWTNDLYKVSHYCVACALVHLNLFACLPGLASTQDRVLPDTCATCLCLPVLLSSTHVTFPQQSTQHRVFNSSGSRPRYSAPFFCNCDFNAVVEPAAIISGGGAAAKYAPITAGAYILQKLGLMWDEDGDGSGSGGGGGDGSSKLEDGSSK